MLNSYSKRKLHIFGSVVRVKVLFFNLISFLLYFKIQQTHGLSHMFLLYSQRFAVSIVFSGLKFSDCNIYSFMLKMNGKFSTLGIH